jgi:hypothetical protein
MVIFVAPTTAESIEIAQEPLYETAPMIPDNPVHIPRQVLHLIVQMQVA